MKTKIGIPIGLALVMFLGVFTAMLAFGTLSPQPAEAQTATATRSISPMSVMSTGTDAERQVTVTITVSGTDSNKNGTGLGSVVETLDSNLVLDMTSVSGARLATGDTAPQAPMYRFTFLGDTATVSYKVTAPATDGTYNITGTVADENRDTSDIAGDTTITVSSTPPEPTDPTVQSLMVSNSPTEPGEVAEFRLTFTTPVALDANVDSITLHFDKDIKNTGQLSGSDIRISASAGTDDTPARPATTPATPTRSVITGATNHNHVEFTITIPDMDPTDDGVGGIGAGASVTVIVLSSAGFTNPTEAHAAGSDAVGVYTNKGTDLQTYKLPVPLVLTLSAYNGNRNKAVTVVGKGFKNGTTADIWLDFNGDGMQDPTKGEITLVNAVPVGSDDTFTSTFTVTVPPFMVIGASGTNYINAIDGENNSMGMGQGKDMMPPKFRVDGLMSISPTSAGIGDDVSLSFDDWPSGATDYSLTIGGVDHKDAYSNGKVTIKPNTPTGVQVLHYKSLKADGSTLEDDTQNITITGADVDITPSSAVPNQTVTIVGRGFTEGSNIVAIQIGSETIPAADINNGMDVGVDSGGNWSASVVIPVNDTSTEANAAHQLRGASTAETARVRHRHGGTIPARTLTIEPKTEARPGDDRSPSPAPVSPPRNTRTSEAQHTVHRVTYDGEVS